MGTDRDTAFGQARDHVDFQFTPFELDHFRATLLHQPSGIAQTGLTRGVTHERHVRHQQRAFDAARHEARVIDHFVHGHGNGGGVALHHHAERVADQDEIHAGFVQHARERRIVGGEARNLLAVDLHLPQAAGGDVSADVVLLAHDAAPSLAALRATPSTKRCSATGART